MWIVWIILGIGLALLFIAYARRQKLMSERRAYAVGLVVAAVIYVGFGLVWGNLSWISIEMGGVLAYGMAAWLGIRGSRLWLAAGWLLHVVWDLGLHLFGPGVHIVPEWYAYACLSFDLLVAAYVVWGMGE